MTMIRTDREIGKLTFTGKRQTLRTKTPGLMIRVNRGSVSFVNFSVSEGRRVMVTLGEWSESFGLDEASLALKRSKDTRIPRRAMPEAPLRTMNELGERFIDKVLSKRQKPGSAVSC